MYVRAYEYMNGGGTLRASATTVARWDTLVDLNIYFNQT